mmetsp:Transcript_21082/g.56245  ORF Transcript_21082/g.56245 Transcript_21082/m.56245 type:complete len:152 (+) Transcript_21082:579-1034(+)
MKFTAFLGAGPLLDFAQKVLGVPIGGRPLQDRDRLKLQKALAKAMVKTTYLPPNQRKYRVVGLTHQGADRLNFEYNGANITVAQYFKNQYGPAPLPGASLREMPPLPRHLRPAGTARCRRRAAQGREAVRAADHRGHSQGRDEARRPHGGD